MFCNKQLPHNLIPHNGDDFSFTIKEPYEGLFLEFVGIGFQYRHSNIEISDILAYGYNDTVLVVKCLDQNNEVKYLASLVEKRARYENLTMIEVESSYCDEVSLTEWIDLDEQIRIQIMRYKTFSFMGFTLACFFLLRELYKYFVSKR